MPIEVDLQAKRTPGGNTNIAKPQFLIDEVEVIVQTLAVSRFEKGLVGLFVMPWLIGLTGLHGGKDVHQSGLGAAPFEDLADAVFLSEILLADEFDLQTVFFGYPLGVIAQFISEWFGKTRVIKDTNAIGSEKSGHPLGIAKGRQCSLNDHSIKTREDS